MELKLSTAQFTGKLRKIFPEYKQELDRISIEYAAMAQADFLERQLYEASVSDRVKTINGITYTGLEGEFWTNWTLQAVKSVYARAFTNFTNTVGFYMAHRKHPVYNEPLEAWVEENSGMTAIRMMIEEWAEYYISAIAGSLGRLEI